ncbi:OmpP1/FadL family transporter [Conchiformibius kuhniae]|uniref:OmpP1/FadL family transporter n=1 Tax=Conchiformibius kuhniae TaxID=211502 RepID=A0ABD8B6Q0_9NEIS|nr:OmpP1/FadL family transporter [Conchiformibius kuhniae]
MLSKNVKPLAWLLCSLFAHQAAASGYHFGTQSVSAQSSANANAAEADDATTVFANPAGVATLENHQVSAALNVVVPHIHYHQAQAVHLNGGTPVQGSTSGKITVGAAVVPHLYGAYKINDRFGLGLGVYTPFASGTEYDKDSVLRYNMNKLGLATIAFEPVLAVKAGERHAFGVGVVAQHSRAQLRKFADWNASGAFDPAVKAATRNPAATANGKADGYAEVEGTDWGFGYHLGWLFDINERVRVGANYRSQVSHTLKGKAKWHYDTSAGSVFATSNPVPTPAGNLPLAAVAKAQVAANGYVPEENASVKIVTPESLSVHGMFKANDKLDLFGDVTWTRHSRFKNATLKFENAKNIGPAGRSDQTRLNPDWRDTVRVSLGGAYRVSAPLQLRAGVAFDQSPVRHAGKRLNTLPDGNRIWWSAGAKYTLKDKHVFDVAYSHIHINDTSMRAAPATGRDVDSKGASSAKFKNYANILGAQYTYRF